MQICILTEGAGLVAECRCAHGGERADSSRPRHARPYPRRRARQGPRVGGSGSGDRVRGDQRRAVADPGRAHALVKQARRANSEADLGAKQLAWPTGIFGALYVDPPWPWTPIARRPAWIGLTDYPTMTVDAIKARDVSVDLRERSRPVPVGDIAPAACKHWK